MIQQRQWLASLESRANYIRALCPLALPPTGMHSLCYSNLQHISLDYVFDAEDA